MYSGRWKLVRLIDRPIATQYPNLIPNNSPPLGDRNNWVHCRGTGFVQVD